MSIQPIEIARILVKETIQQRVQLNENVISEYFEEIQAGAQFPPLVVFGDGQNLILADGRHRYEAYKLAGTNDIPVDILNGTERDAILYAVGANADHGLRRTNADKRCAVETMLKDEEWGQWSDGAIAEKVCVSPAFVGKVRRELTLNGFEFSSKRIGKDGRTLETSNIGSRNTGTGSEIEQSNVDEASEIESQDTSQNAQGIEGSDAVDDEPTVNADNNGPDAEENDDAEGIEDGNGDVSAETRDEVTEDASSDESEGRGPESLREITDEDQGEASVSDAENPGQEQSSEPEPSSPVQTDDIKALRHQIAELEQIVRKQDRQLYLKDQRIAELEEKLAYYEHEILAS